jgi:hypothetical protein
MVTRKIPHRILKIKSSKIREVTTKVDEAKKKGIDIVNFSIGRPDFDTPDHIKEAAKKALDQGEEGRPENYKLIRRWGVIECFVPRKARIEYPGGIHHLIVRGIEGKQIFYEDQDCNASLDLLEFLVLESKTSRFARVQLPNYLLLRNGQTPVATLMRRFLSESETG